MSTKLDRTSNRLTVSQKALHCGEIRKTFCVGMAQEITSELRERAERELRSDPEHQRSYYDLILVTPQGAELDFETNIL